MLKNKYIRFKEWCCLLLVFTFSHQTLSAQEDVIKKTRIKINESIAKKDLSKLGDNYFHLAYNFHIKSQGDSAIFYYRASIPLLTPIKNYLLLGKAFQNLSSLFVPINTDTALYFAKRSLYYRELNKDSVEIADACFQIAYVEDERGQFNEALKYNLKATKIFELKNDTNRLVNAYNNLAILYEHLQESERTLYYYYKTLQALEGGKDGKKIAGSYMNLGNYYTQHKLYDSAMFNYSKALSIHQKIENERGIGECYFNIADLLFNKGNCNEALPIIKKSISIFDKIDPRVSKMYGSRLYGLILDCLGNYNLSERYLIEAYQETKKNNSIIELNAVTNILAKHYALTSDFKRAYQFKIEYEENVDSLFSVEKVNVSKQLEKKYESEKKELQIAKLKQQEAFQKSELLLAATQKKNQILIIVFTVITLVIVIFFAILLFRRLKLTRKQKEIIEEQKELVEEKQKEILDSINYAKRIQYALLAHNDFISSYLHEYFIVFKPKDVVSGDFYWASKLSNGNFALVTADSTGHGVPGAIMSLLNITSLEKAIETTSNPAEILNLTRKFIIERLKKDGSIDGGKDGMDCTFISINKECTKLEVAAAQNPVWIMRGEEIIEIKADKMPVGKHDKQNESFTLQELKIQKGDVIYTLTDGFPDQFGGLNGKKFMSKKLRALLHGISQKPIKEQKLILEKTFTDWIGGLEQVDDVTIIGVRV